MPIQALPSFAMNKALAQPSVGALVRAVNAAAARHIVQLILSARQATVSAQLASTSTDPPTAPSAPTKFLVLTTPRRSKIVEKIFKRASLSDIQISVLPFGFLPFDANLVTLNWLQAFLQIVLDGDNSAILATAAGFSSMPTALNLEFATIRSAGAAAAAVAEELLETHGQMYSVNRHHSDSLSSSVQSSPAVSTRHMTASAFAAHHNFSLLDVKSAPANLQPARPKYDSQMPTLAQVVDISSKRRAVNLFMVDNGCDLLSPLLNQGTYEGLLNEAIGLHNNIIDLPISSIISGMLWISCDPRAIRLSPQSPPANAFEQISTPSLVNCAISHFPQRLTKSAPWQTRCKSTMTLAQIEKRPKWESFKPGCRVYKVLHRIILWL